jgi:hypothetical protein
VSSRVFTLKFISNRTQQAHSLRGNVAIDNYATSTIKDRAVIDFEIEKVRQGLQINEYNILVSLQKNRDLTFAITFGLLTSLMRLQLLSQLST